MNKKKIFGSIAVIAIAAMAAFNVNVNTQENGLSDVSLENMEALASETLHGPYYANVESSVTWIGGMDGYTMVTWKCSGLGSSLCP